MCLMQIATGSIEDSMPGDGKDKAAQALGAKGSRMRAERMSPERRAEVGRQRLGAGLRNNLWNIFLHFCRDV